jgi:hypothetical protein
LIATIVRVTVVAIFLMIVHSTPRWLESPLRRQLSSRAERTIHLA